MIKGMEILVYLGDGGTAGAYGPWWSYHYYLTSHGWCYDKNFKDCYL